MSIIITLILVSLFVALGFLGAFVWATKGGQFDDDFTPAIRILFDDAPKTGTDAGSNSPPEVSGHSNSTNPTFSTISTKEDE